MIEAIDTGNIDEVLPLIRKYQAFYKVANIDDDKNKEFFSQFGYSSSKGCLFAYRFDGQFVAFATVYFSYASSITSKIGILNDLYTSKPYRLQGLGRQLIQHCETYAKENGALRLQWVTAPSNEAAKSVYRSLGAKQSSWEFFTL